MTWEPDALRPLVVGALFSETGPTAYVERTQFNAAMLAIEEVNASGGVAGCEVSIVSHDAESSPARFSQLAEQMLDDEQASLLIGCYMSNTRQAIVPVVERRAVVLGYTAPYEGFEYSPYLIYGGAVPNQHIMLLARHLITNIGKRFYLVGTRYAFPIESNRVMMTLVAEQKGQVVAERYVKLDAQHRELKAIVDDIKAKKPDVVFSTVVGEAVRLFYEICQDAGIAAHTQIASLTITEAELGLMKPGLAEGHLTAATYFQSIETPVNRRFVLAYKARFGANSQTNAMAETAYALTHMLLAAVARGGSVNANIIRSELAKAKFDAPQGPMRMDADNNHFWLWPRIGRARADGQFAIVEESPVAIKPDPYLVNHSLSDWLPAQAAANLASS